MSDTSPIPAFAASGVEAMYGEILRDAVLDQIEQSRDRLWLAYFLIALDPAGGRTSNAMIDALVRAAHRHVDVRILASPFESGPERLRANAPAFAWMASRKLEVREFRPQRYPNGRVSQRRSMHSKFLVRDSEVAVVGSGNLTPGGTDNNHELALLVESADLAHSLATRHSWMWQRAARVD
jgi:phosphatidylserine/phosphatidylglycerophosphate/cardiolipin synthase-like enzyme